LTRQVPAYDAQVFEERRGALCLGIPVINEGERIRRQLDRMRTAGIDMDIAVADGGSTDGSVAPEFLRSVGVRALLTKRGPGKLSAQMRMYFDWALDQGYDGLLLMDGNDKDGLDGLINVRRAIEDGYDFVQGSRYVPGGRHANTPLDRELGVRLVHAPVLSLAARHRYTDTTNGLRGYSRRFLLDPRVDPFRDLFETYNLHYYLSVRAPRLGYRVREVPAERNYPDEGPVPSKIGGLRSRLHILRLLAEAATGRYDPT
jgi:dolichol-phosphate mannosyltransferase